jgi:ubiquinone/menaquinone biosynthesis C-methylase UbiE
MAKEDAGKFMAIPVKMLSLLRDPMGLEPFEIEGDVLVNKTSHRSYPIKDSIPILLNETDLGPQNIKIQKMYQWMAAGFDFANRIGNLLSLGGITKLRRQLASGLGLKPGDRVLYTSIGTGLDLPFLAGQVPLDAIELVGLDLSLEMLRKCQLKMRAYEKTSLLVQANAERLPFADGAFDVVLHVGGINQFDRPAVAVQEMIRVAKPGVRIVIADETKGVVKSQYQKYNPFTRSTFKNMPTDFDPRDWIPAGIRDVVYQEAAKGKIYFLTFKSPLQ